MFLDDKPDFVAEGSNEWPLTEEVLASNKAPFLSTRPTIIPFPIHLKIPRTIKKEVGVSYGDDKWCCLVDLARLSYSHQFSESVQSQCLLVYRKTFSFLILLAYLSEMQRTIMYIMYALNNKLVVLRCNGFDL